MAKSKKQSLYEQIEECRKAQNSADEKTLAIIETVADNFRELCKVESQRDGLLEACKNADHLITNHAEGGHRAFVECRNDLRQAISKAEAK